MKECDRGRSFVSQSTEIQYDFLSDSCCPAAAGHPGRQHERLCLLCVTRASTGSTIRR